VAGTTVGLGGEAGSVGASGRPGDGPADAWNNAFASWAITSGSGQEGPEGGVGDDISPQLLLPLARRRRT
jgi:hypothetical protein